MIYTLKIEKNKTQSNSLISELNKTYERIKKRNGKILNVTSFESEIWDYPKYRPGICYVITVEFPDKVVTNTETDILKKTIRDFIETCISVPEVNKTYLWEDMICDKLQNFGVKDEDIDGIIESSIYCGFNLKDYHDEIVNRVTEFMKTL